MQAPPTRDGPRVNEEIRVPQVRLIDQDGEMMGVAMTARDRDAAGLRRRPRQPGGDQPERRSACLQRSSIMAEVQIRTAEEAERGQRRQKVIEIKEIEVRPNIDENDYQVKMRAMKSFIDEGDKVKVTLRFRGREMAHQDIGVRVLERIRAEMDVTTKVEQMPRLENRQMVMVLSPK